MIVFYGSDLTWAVKIKSTAEALGIHARPARSIDMLEARLADSPPEPVMIAFIADLAEPEIALSLIERVRDENRRRSEKREEELALGGSSGEEESPTRKPIRILAFGPHVEVDALQRARDLGAHEVMTRGAFSANLPDILVRLNG
jgi:hypothetical protein